MLSPGQCLQISNEHRQPYITAKRDDSFQSAAIKTQASLDPGTDRLHTGSEAAKALIDTWATAHIFHFQAPFIGKTNVLYPETFFFIQIVLGRENAIQRCFKGIAAVYFLLSIEHLKGKGGIGGIAVGNQEVLDQL